MHIKDILDTFFAKALAEHVFPGAGVACSWKDIEGINHEFYRVYGSTAAIGKSLPVKETTFFDLASLTKPLVTVLSLLVLIDSGKLSLDSPLKNLLPEFPIAEDKKNIRLSQLMSHCSGFPAYRPFYTGLLGFHPEQRKQVVLRRILAEELTGTGEKYVYSDLGYMLLGMIVEHISGKALNSFFRETILVPLKLGSEFLFPAVESVENAEFCATEVCPWSHVPLKGKVHDDNCRVLGGVMGHAGLFGTLPGVLALTRYLADLHRGEAIGEIIPADLFRQVCKRQKGTTWSCGFDMPSSLGSSSGKYFSEKSIGHLGFTGTSFWVDTEKGITIVLLTNRVCPSRKNEKIKRFRPRLHNIIMERLLKKKKCGT